MKLKKLKILMNLWILTLLGKHTKKADVIKKANLFKSYGGGGGVLASVLDTNSA